MSTPEHEGRRWVAECAANMHKELHLTPLQIASVLMEEVTSQVNLARYQDPKEGMDK